MCEQCIAATQSYTKSEDDAFLEKYCLVRATRDGGGSMKINDWGLVVSNDPDFIFSVIPWPSPWSDCTEKELDALCREDSNEDFRWISEAEKFGREIYDSGSLDSITNLILLCQKNGWVNLTSFKEDGSDKSCLSKIHYWLFHHLGLYMTTHSAPIADEIVKVG